MCNNNYMYDYYNNLDMLKSLYVRVCVWLMNIEMKERVILFKKMQIHFKI